MSINHYLLQHAIANVWCNPTQDRQVRLKLARLTSAIGAQDYYSVQRAVIDLPKTKTVYHIFQIGQNHPYDFGLGTPPRTWVALSDLCERNALVVNLYLETGLQFPRTECYLYIAENHNLIIAIKDQPKIGKAGSQDVYMRVYSNAYYNSDRSAENRGILCRGGTVVSTAKALQLQRAYHTLQSQDGLVQMFLNGRLVNDIPPGSVGIGDVAEYFYDPSVFKVVDLPIAGLETFVSSLDSKRKYLLHPPVIADDDAGNDRIIYRDDIDVWLTDSTGVGLYFHKNMEDSLRMITHRDYSIPVQYLSQQQQSQTAWTDLTKLNVRLVMRESGYDRPLIFEHHRIRELYKLSETRLMRAMLGLDSTLPEWTAAGLESSSYPYLMRCQYSEITQAKITDAYGYNAMTQVVANSPLVPENNNGVPRVEMPADLQLNATVYEYDADGLLLGYYIHNTGLYYYPTNEECALVEPRSGLGGRELDATFGTDPVVLTTDNSYRCYVATVKSGVSQGDWKDVTGSGKYIEQDGVITWALNPVREVGLVISNATFLAYDLSLNYRDRMLKFSLTYGDDAGQLATIPPGRINLWLNGHPIIEGLDYIVQGTVIMIVTKRYLNTEGAQLVTVRCTGFASATLEREPPDDIGWVQHGRISYNDRFNLRDDRVIRCVVNGRVAMKNQLVFAEDVNLKPRALIDIPDGSPYQINNVEVPIRGLSDYDTYYLRERSLDLDSRVSDYMTEYDPESEIDEPVVIKEKYPTYSPMLAKILYDCLLGIINVSGFTITPKQLDALVEPYKYLMAFDPCLQDWDWTFVTVHPHEQYVEVEVTESQYRLLEKVSKAYLKDKVDFTPFLSISKGS